MAAAVSSNAAVSSTAVPSSASSGARVGTRIRAALQAPFEETDTAALVATRVIYGLVMAISVWRLLHYGWLDDFFAKPTTFFTYYGFSFVKPLSVASMHVLAWGLCGLGICVSIGFFYRLSLALLLIGFAYLELVDVTNYLNHYYLAVLFGGLMLMMPLGRAGSIDARLFPRQRVTSFPAWATWLLRFQVGTVYFYAGMAKAQSDWLLHAQPLNLWLSARTSTPVIGPWLDERWVAYAMSWGGFLFDSTVAFFLLSGRTRRYAFAVVVMFHLTTQLLFPIGMFPTIMITSALVFFPPSWPRKFIDRLGRWAKLPLPSTAQPTSALTRRRKVGLALAAAYVVFQISMPLRAHAYGGNVLWHEQGMRFSWKVMVREKNGSITYYVDDPESGRTYVVSPRRYLTDRQAREFSSQPDMILALAHKIRDDYRAKGVKEPRVHAEAWVSLNGRPPSLMIDPKVDLAAVSDGVGKATWILPAPEGAPIHLRPLR